MHISKYQWILFDADETLFHFDAFAGLKLLFSKYNIAFNQSDFDHYQKVNKPLWVEYQNGTINAQTLQTQRFVEWGAKLAVKPEQLNHDFLMAMADICQPLPGAKALIDALIGKVLQELKNQQLDQNTYLHFYNHPLHKPKTLNNI